MKSNSRNDILLHNLVALLAPEIVRVLVERAADEHSLLPQVGGEESVGVGHSGEGGLEGVLEGLCGAGRLGVCILDTSKLHETLDGGGCDKSGTAGSWDQLQPLLIIQSISTTWNQYAYPDGDGTALSGLLSSQGMGLSKRGAPVSTADGKDGQLGDDDGSTDGSRNFLGGLNAEADVTLGVTNNDDGLETGTLTGTGLLLDGLDL